MSQNLNETLSAMMDGEANELEMRRALKDADSESMETWSRYQTVSSIMKQDKDLFLGSDISAAVAAAVADEKTPRQGMSAGLKSGLSFAAAACVTLAVFAGLQLNTSDEGLVPAVPQVAETEQNNTPVFAGGQGLSLQAEQGFATVSGQVQLQSEQVVTERAVADAIAADRLNAHLGEHSLSNSLNNNEGVLPFARMESTEE